MLKHYQKGIKLWSINQSIMIENLTSQSLTKVPYTRQDVYSVIPNIYTMFINITTNYCNSRISWWSTLLIHRRPIKFNHEWVLSPQMQCGLELDVYTSDNFIVVNTFHVPHAPLYGLSKYSTLWVSLACRRIWLNGVGFQQKKGN
jgi:hypothetical protein